MSERGNMPVLEGIPLEDYIQQFVAGVARLPGTMVRPRWQPEPPNIPDYGVNWAAVGINRQRPIGTYPAIIHHCENDTGGPGYDEMQRHEELDVLVTFYGPQADVYSENLHNGLQIWQNYSVLLLVGMALVDIQEGVRVPELIKERWWNRVDKPMTLRRIVRRSYPVLNVLGAEGWVITDGSGQYQAPFTVPPASVGQPAFGHSYGFGFALAFSSTG